MCEVGVALDDLSKDQLVSLVKEHRKTIIKLKREIEYLDGKPICPDCGNRCNAIFIEEKMTATYGDQTLTSYGNMHGELASDCCEALL